MDFCLLILACLCVHVIPVVSLASPFVGSSRHRCPTREPVQPLPAFQVVPELVAPIPLLGAKADVLITDYCAEITLAQRYENREEYVCHLF